MQTRELLASVSAIALTVGVADVAQAQDTGEAAGYSLSFQGTFGRLDNAPADKWGASGGGDDYQDKFGDPNTDMGYMGAISLERRASPERDIRLTFSVGGSLNNDRSFSSGFSGGISGGIFSPTVTNDLSFAAMDVEIGHHRAVGSNDLRLFAGLRGMTSSTSSDKVGSVVSGGGDFSASQGVTLESDFVGVGPRVGVGYSTKPAVGSFGFSGQIGAAALFGTRKDRAESAFSVSSGGSGGSFSFSESNSDSQTVLSLDAQIGVNYYVSENSKISVGYAAQQLWNVDAFSDSDAIDVGPRLIDGVFLGFTTQF